MDRQGEREKARESEIEYEIGRMNNKVHFNKTFILFSDQFQGRELFIDVSYPVVCPQSAIIFLKILQLQKIKTKNKKIVLLLPNL